MSVSEIQGRLARSVERLEHYRHQELRGAHEHASLEAILLGMAEVGSPRLAQAGDGQWYCCVEMRVNQAGAQFEVKSEFNNPSPRAAVVQCLVRVLGAIQGLG